MAMAFCPKDQYWDSSRKSCVSCALTCSQRSQRTCTDFCKFINCRKEQGRYYDHLLGACVSCDSTCTQHPQQCAHFCEKRPRSQANLQPELGRPQAGEVEVRSDNSGRHQGSEHGPGLRLSSDQLTLYCTLGVCLCAIFCCFLVALASFLRRRGEPLPSQPAGPRGSQANSPHAHRPVTEACDEVTASPQPVETCSFCFPERSSPTQESAPRSLGIHGFAGTAAPQPCMRATVGGLGVLRASTGDARPAT
ncbi:tumor necrosis factor receptor superfamily member 13B isoform X1 [Mus musculus]|uniref:Tumor necrosis factor receptor superfamily member 13B n=3 Tax=Mus musculus TaxID=10090 RepID=TR13B_MOUSE|nr:tumor necrosis factor receptor superfamily member 13B [Mus musculus]XP_006533914.1 tumor necrosis factor receptor superfamily member 13B isoform X1 [Mus musculus]Q9ET35.1 RecName: Full=Tumor necrosis factor receptor superfamily member 13B; AltName: Full=Transmembrane activator and CAML interactor; AltName: CD_antigen=CD267 [Mus musculus]AAG00081.1 TACI protein [Mus musculus]AAI39393.1 Tumor necrosis factor receptor superfamily, member 13b [Mus musculus]AAI39394.1 Tumor necrosis factor recep|eukprot:NP_067324.1 tumor necrosis factor receptor superfamily member 13B [Mus musculus]